MWLASLKQQQKNHALLFLQLQNSGRMKTSLLAWKSDEPSLAPWQILEVVFYDVKCRFQAHQQESLKLVKSPNLAQNEVKYN
jgi:hypothetical protein